MTDRQEQPVYDRVEVTHAGHQEYVPMAALVVHVLDGLRRHVAVVWDVYESGKYADAAISARACVQEAEQLAQALERLACDAFDPLAKAKRDLAHTGDIF